jgi:hypothetical protein
MTATTPRQILEMLIALDGMVQLATGGNTYGDILAAYEGRELTNEEAAVLARGVVAPKVPSAGAPAPA